MDLTTKLLSPFTGEAQAYTMLSGNRGWEQTNKLKKLLAKSEKDDFLTKFYNLEIDDQKEIISILAQYVAYKGYTGMDLSRRHEANLTKIGAMKKGLIAIYKAGKDGPISISDHLALIKVLKQTKTTDETDPTIQDIVSKLILEQGLDKVTVNPLHTQIYNIEAEDLQDELAQALLAALKQDGELSITELEKLFELKEFISKDEQLDWENLGRVLRQKKEAARKANEIASLASKSRAAASLNSTVTRKRK